MNPFAPSSSFTPAIQAPEQGKVDALWFAFQNDGSSFRKNSLLVRQTGSTYEIPQASSLKELNLTSIRQHFSTQLFAQFLYQHRADKTHSTTKRLQPRTTTRVPWPA